jgi:hypothetical protein
LIGAASKRRASIEEAAVGLQAALDHLKHNLSFLVGELGAAPANSYYVLDNMLRLKAMNIEGARKSYHELTEPAPVKVESTKLRQALQQFSQSLSDRGDDERFTAALVQAIDQMLVATDAYYAEMNAFVECEPQPITLLYRFRRVESAGMHLLATVILTETMIETFRYIFMD